LSFDLQKGSSESIPDAVITQPSFKIVVETKRNSNFDIDQLKRHLSSFEHEKYKVLLTLDPKEMDSDFKEKLRECIKQENLNVIHKHLTFEELVSSVSEEISDRDYEMRDMLDDYEEYCFESNLICDTHKWMMRAQAANQTIEINKKLNLFYCDAKRGFSSHRYLGLYADKAVRCIGKIVAVATAKSNGDSIKIEKEGKCVLPTDAEERIRQAIQDTPDYGSERRYFFVEEFYDTLFKKTSPYPLISNRRFNLCKVLGEEILPEKTEEIAKLLRDKTWE